MTDFQQVQPNDPTEVSSLVIQLKYKLVEGEDPSKTIGYQVTLLDENGARVNAESDSGNLMPYMTQAQIEAAETFLDSMYNKAQQLIPNNL